MKPFEKKTCQLTKGDSIYLMSDGFSDQFGGNKQRKYLSKKLKAKIIENSSSTMKEQSILLEKELAEWMGKSEQVDDVTILGIRI